MPVCGNGMSATANDILREGAEFSKMNQDTFQLAADSRVYDDRYETNYRQRVDGLEVARWNALAHFIRMVACPVWGGRVLDYGAGAGMHVALWEQSFPSSELHFTDISLVAKRRFADRYSRHEPRYQIISGDGAPFPANWFDAVVSVEVMEHVHDLDSYLSDILRVLRPGGVFIWTTPCGNRGSIEHLWSLLFGQVKATSEGYRLWAWEDPTHVRRLRTSEADSRLRRVGFSHSRYRLRSHFFSFVGTYFPPRTRLMPLREQLMRLDYALFRNLPNGASMLGAAWKPEQKSSSTHL